MCGYAFVSCRHKKAREINTNLMHHRGPDHTKEIDLGWCRTRHWRLSIQDLTSNSNQPISNQDHHLVYNGELYDFKNISSKNFLKSFDSDTQLMFHVLKEDNFELIKNQSGFYSFIFINDLGKEFFSARDPFGKKPLYYYFDDDLLVVASEDKAVRSLAQEYGKDVSLNKISIAHYLRYKDLHFGNTFFNNINELAPGSSLEFDFENWSLSKSISWEDYYYSEPFYKFKNLENNSNDPSQNILPQLKDHLINAINKRFNADVPIQLALSGGIDSTLLALVANHCNRHFERALTVSSNSRPSELSKSKKLCDKFSINHEVIDFNDIDFLALLKKAIRAQAAPLSHPHALALFVISEKTSNQGKVLITGEGADELMYGYEHHKKKNFSFAFLEHINPSEYFEIRGDDKTDMLKKLSLNEFLKNNDYRDLEVKTHLLSLLRRNDRISMKNSIELRSAYLDFELFKFVSYQQKIGTLRKGKSSLVKIIKDFFESYEADEEKIGFYFPFDEWFEEQRNNTVLKNYIEISESFFKTTFNWTLKDKSNVKGKLAWALINLGVFLEMEG